MNSLTNQGGLGASPKTGHTISIITGGKKYCKDDTRAAPLDNSDCLQVDHGN